MLRLERVVRKPVVVLVELGLMAEAMGRLGPWELVARAVPLPLVLAVVAVVVGTMAVVGAEVMEIHLIILILVPVAAGQDTIFLRLPMFPQHSVDAEATAK